MMNRYHFLFCISSLLIGCMPPGYYAGGTTPTGTAGTTTGTTGNTPEAPADDRDPGQKFVDAIANDYSCEHESDRWRCIGKVRTPDPNGAANWPFYVYFAAANDGVGTNITLASSSYRAFGVTCARFERYTSDLYESRSGFSATCSDDDKMFTMNTDATFQPDALTDPTQTASWVTQHLSSRVTAWKLLRSVGALRTAG